MKRLYTVATLLLGALLVAASAEARAGADDVRASIEAASTALLDASASRDQIVGALVRLLEAAVLTLPPSALGADAKPNLEAAISDLKERSDLGEKLHQHLALAYRALSGGKAFQFPDTHSIEEARAHIKSLAASSVVSLKKGQSGQTSRLLVECVIMVVTPISR